MINSEVTTQKMTMKVRNVTLVTLAHEQYQYTQWKGLYSVVAQKTKLKVHKVTLVTHTHVHYQYTYIERITTEASGSEEGVSHPPNTYFPAHDKRCR